VGERVPHAQASPYFVGVLGGGHALQIEFEFLFFGPGDESLVGFEVSA
jgi:hypothetical protein